MARTNSQLRSAGGGAQRRGIANASLRGATRPSNLGIGLHPVPRLQAARRSTPSSRHYGGLANCYPTDYPASFCGSRRSVYQAK